jgi:hypothetical protein
MQRSHIDWKTETAGWIGTLADLKGGNGHFLPPLKNRFGL